MRVLICSPVRQTSDVLSVFLQYITKQTSATGDPLFCDFYFIDDNIDKQSSMLLQAFRKEYEGLVCIDTMDDLQQALQGEAHEWTPQLITRLAEIRNRLLLFGLQGAYDYMLTIDSDIILQPGTIAHLIAQKRDIITEIHWTPIAGGIHPNVWLYDCWDFAYREPHEERISRAKSLQRMAKFFDLLRQPGQYQVGGVCGLTLISRAALEAGMSYTQVYNLSTASEDYHFSVRAAAKGFKLFVDTQLPAYHLFNRDMIDQLPSFLKLHYCASSAVKGGAVPDATQ